MSDCISKGQYYGLILLAIAVMMLFLPPLLMGTPVPMEIYFPLAIFGMIFGISGFLLLVKVFGDLQN